MQRKPLGASDIEVSTFCLGTMTYGTNTPEDESHRQLDYSLEQGINFLDTAEMYPVNPVKKKTIGVTEEIIGRWNSKSGRRSEYVIATVALTISARFGITTHPNRIVQLRLHTWKMSCPH